MFHETVTSADGSTETGTCGEAHAVHLLRTAAQRGYRVEATRDGGVIITRDVHRGGSVPARHTVTLEPATATGRITATMRLDLGIVDNHAGARHLRSRFDPETGRINAGLNSIPPTAAGRLIRRGLVTVTGDAVAVSLAARLTMLAQDHHTTTREPRGYVRPSDIGLGHLSAGLNKPGGRAGKIYDRSSGASCSCRAWSAPAEDRDSARRAAREHREQVAKAMIARFATAG